LPAVSRRARLARCLRELGTNARSDAADDSSPAIVPIGQQGLASGRRHIHTRAHKTGAGVVVTAAQTGTTMERRGCTVVVVVV
jgi:hypothetical protein